MAKTVYWKGRFNTTVNPIRALGHVRGWPLDAFAEQIKEATQEQLRMTRVHRLFSAERGLVPASELRVGDHLRTEVGEDREVISIAAGAMGVTVHNVTVEGSHTYFVGQARIWVHNDKHTTSQDDPPSPPPDDDTEGSSAHGSSDSGGGGSEGAGGKSGPA
jgi:hypothetical protein